MKFSSQIQNAKLMLWLYLAATYQTTNCRCHFATYNGFSPCSFLSRCVRVLYLPRTVPSFSCCCWTISHHSRNISAVGEWQDFFLVERREQEGARARSLPVSLKFEGSPSVKSIQIRATAADFTLRNKFASLSQLNM